MAQLRRILVLAAACLAFVVPQARAGVIASDEAQSGGAQQERERLKAALERPEIAQAIEKFGVAADDARRRVDAMTDAEVRMLAGKIDALPAGGALSNTDLMIIILLVIILALVL